MFQLNNLLPPTKYLLLQIIAILLAVFYGSLGLNKLMWAADGYLLWLFLGTFFCLLAVSTWRLRYWAFQFTCAVLVFLSIFSPFGFFSIYGFKFGVTPSVYTLFWQFILFNVCSLGFVVIIQFVYKKELIHSL
jgi:hypothetical protein